MDTMSFTAGDIHETIKDFLGNDNIETEVYTWLTLANRNVSLLFPWLLGIDEFLVPTTGTINQVYGLPLASRDKAYLLHEVSLLDENDVEEDWGRMRNTTLLEIWQREHRKTITSEIRQPEIWASAGVVLDDFSSQDGDDGYLGFRIWPQPTSGQFVGRNMKVYALVIEDDFSSSSGTSLNLEQARKLILDAALRYAHLYVEDKGGYLISRAEFNRHKEDLKKSFRGASGSRARFGG